MYFVYALVAFVTRCQELFLIRERVKCAWKSFSETSNPLALTLMYLATLPQSLALK